MDYKGLYDRLIARARERTLTGLFEEHHILPVCLGGQNAPENLVALTLREHYIAHLCLVKLTSGTNQQKMLSAVLFFKTRPEVTNGRTYAIVREAYAKTMVGHTRNVGNKHPISTRRKMSASLMGNTRNLGKKRSAASKAKVKTTLREYYASHWNALKGTTLSTETRKRMSDGQKGKPKSEAHKQKLREAALRQWAQKREMNNAAA